MKYTIDNGLIVDSTTTPPTCCGHIFSFSGRAFSPDGEVQFNDAQIAEHNRLLDVMLIEGLDKNCEIGQGGTFYWSRDKGITTWTGTHVADYTIIGAMITFKRAGKTYRGRTQKDAQCFNFWRVA